MKGQTDNQQAWWDEFRGRCVSCLHAQPSTRKHEMTCILEKAARNKGLPSRPGGTWFGEPVHKLFGCVFFASAKTEERKQ
jgi:hypothetical protein